MANRFRNTRKFLRKLINGYPTNEVYEVAEVDDNIKLDNRIFKTLVKDAKLVQLQNYFAYGVIDEDDYPDYQDYLDEINNVLVYALNSIYYNALNSAIKGIQISVPNHGISDAISNALEFDYKEEKKDGYTAIIEDLKLYYKNKYDDKLNELIKHINFKSEVKDEIVLNKAPSKKRLK